MGWFLEKSRKVDEAVKPQVPDIWAGLTVRDAKALREYAEVLERCDLGRNFEELEWKVVKLAGLFPSIEAVVGQKEAELGARTDHRSVITAETVESYLKYLAGNSSGYEIQKRFFDKRVDGGVTRDENLYSTFIYGSSGTLLNPAFDRREGGVRPPRLVAVVGEGVDMEAFPFNGSTETRIEWGMRMIVPTFDVNDYPVWGGITGEYGRKIRDRFASVLDYRLLLGIVEGNIGSKWKSICGSFGELKRVRKEYINKLVGEIGKYYRGYKGMENTSIIVDLVRLLGATADAGAMFGVYSAVDGVKRGFEFRRRTTRVTEGRGNRLTVQRRAGYGGERMSEGEEIYRNQGR